MLHFHVDPTGPKLVEHLSNALVTRCWLFRAANPTEIVVALVTGALLVVDHQTLADQTLLDVGRHRVCWSGRHRPIEARSTSKRNAALEHGGNWHERSEY